MIRAESDNILLAPLLRNWRVTLPSVAGILVLGGVGWYLGLRTLSNTVALSISAGLLFVGLAIEYLSAVRLAFTDYGVIVRRSGLLGDGALIAYGDVVRVEADLGRRPLLRIILRDGAIEVGPFPVGYDRRCRTGIERAAQLIKERLAH